MCEKIKKIPSDLLIILVWVVSTVIFIITPLEDSIIRLILGIPMVLFIPGYTLLSALFPKKDFDITERIALSFGLSIAVVSLIGLGLNFTRFGIRLIPILISLTTYTIFLIILGTYTRYITVEHERFSIPLHKIYLDFVEIFKMKDKIDIILKILLMMSIIITISLLAYVIIIPKTGEKFTEFYVLNSTTEHADNYSTNLKIHQPVKYLIGVANHEYSDVNYTIEAIITDNILFTTNLTIENDDIWEDNLLIIPDKKGDNMKLKFLLFKENNFTSPYRELHLWVNVS